MATISYDAEAYDLINFDRNVDLDWYGGLADCTNGTVLEIGAGTGRVTTRLAKNAPVVAVEPDSAMLVRLEERLAELDLHGRPPPQVIATDLLSFESEQLFDLIVLPFRTFQHALGGALQKKWILKLKALLAPGGILSFDVFNPSLDLISGASGPFAGMWRLTDYATRPNGGFLLLSETTEYSIFDNAFTSFHKNEFIDIKGGVEKTFIQTLQLSMLFADDLTSLLNGAGFADFKIYGGFSNDALSSEATDLVVQARL
jgi:SAM-dependent methyltransferase